MIARAVDPAIPAIITRLQNKQHQLYYTEGSWTKLRSTDVIGLLMLEHAQLNTNIM